MAYQWLNKHHICEADERPRRFPIFWLPEHGWQLAIKPKAMHVSFCPWCGEALPEIGEILYEEER